MSKKLLLLFLCVFLTSSAWGARRRGGINRVGLEITPIVGYEITQKLLPTAHQTQRLIYGARITWGLMIIAAELEYYRARDTESFNEGTTATVDETDRAKVGIRSRLRMGSLFAFVLRAGAQATRNINYSTTNSIVTTTEESIKYKPYAGAGLDIQFTRHLSANADVVAVFNDFPDNYSNLDYQAVAGLTIRFP